MKSSFFSFCSKKMYFYRTNLSSSVIILSKFRKRYYSYLLELKILVEILGRIKGLQCTSKNNQPRVLLSIIVHLLNPINSTKEVMDPAFSSLFHQYIGQLLLAQIECYSLKSLRYGLKQYLCLYNPHFG